VFEFENEFGRVNLKEKFDECEIVWNKKRIVRNEQI